MFVPVLYVSGTVKRPDGRATAYSALSIGLYYNATHTKN